MTPVIPPYRRDSRDILQLNVRGNTAGRGSYALVLTLAIATHLVSCFGTGALAQQQVPQADHPPAPSRAGVNPTEKPDDARRRIDHLRSLPYVGGSPRKADDARGVVTLDPRQVAPGWTLYTIQPLNRSELIDATGQVRKSWSHGTSLVWQRSRLFDGDLVVIGTDDHRPEGYRGMLLPDAARYLMRMTPDGAIRWKSYLPAHHDVLPLDPRNWVALTFARRKLPRFHRQVDVRDDTLSWIDPLDGTVRRSRSLLDAILASPENFPLQPGRPSNASGQPWIDLLHANAVQRIPPTSRAGSHPLYTPGAWLVTFRHQDRVAVFDSELRRVLWSWGRGELGGPHDAQLLDNGQLLIFDNGLGRNRSRVIELDPIREAVTWTYSGTPPESFYTASKGSAQRLPNGNTLIAESDRGRIIEVTRDGTIVWEFLCPYDTPDRQRPAIVRARRVPAHGSSRPD